MSLLCPILQNLDELAFKLSKNHLKEAVLHIESCTKAAFLDIFSVNCGIISMREIFWWNKISLVSVKKTQP